MVDDGAPGGRGRRTRAVACIVSVAVAGVLLGGCGHAGARTRAARCADTGGTKPSQAERACLLAKVARIASSWARGDAKGFVDEWSRHVDLAMPAEKVLERTEQDRAFARDHGGNPTEIRFLDELLLFVGPIRPGGPGREAGAQPVLRSESTLRLLEAELRRYFADVPTASVLVVDSIERNRTFGADDWETERGYWEGVEPRVWSVHADVDPAAWARGFGRAVTFRFGYEDDDWKLTRVLVWPFSLANTSDGR
jgi:hypothetical protein